MTTEVRDNKQGQKNSPRGNNEQDAGPDDRKKGALEHGHGKNQSTATTGGGDSKAPKAKSRG